MDEKIHKIYKIIFYKLVALRKQLPWGKKRLSDNPKQVPHGIRKVPQRKK
jgi:hypothetical protein